MNTNSLVWLTIPAALFSMSCGDAVPPPAEGTVSITVSNSGSAKSGYGCPGGSHTLTLGAEGPNDSSKGVTWIDGQGGKSVSCEVSGDGSYTISGSISAGTSGNFFVSASGVASGATGKAVVSVFDPNMAMTLRSTDDCSISLKEVEKGAVWATLSCTRLGSSADMYVWCQASATFVFKSCDK